MVIKINDLKWKVIFAPCEHEKLQSNSAQCLGITYFGDLQIYINKDISDELIKQTIVHELTHAFLFSYGIHIEGDNENKLEEMICDFCGAYLDKINKISRKIIKAWKSKR